MASDPIQSFDKLILLIDLVWIWRPKFALRPLSISRYRILQNTMLMPMFWKISFVVSIDNKLFRLFHTFGCKQNVPNMLTNFSAFAANGDAQDVQPVKYFPFWAMSDIFIRNTSTRPLLLFLASTVVTTTTSNGAVNVRVVLTRGSCHRETFPIVERECVRGATA